MKKFEVERFLITDSGRYEMKWTVGTKIGGGYGLAILILVIIGVATYLSTASYIKNSELVVHTHEVLATQDNLLSTLVTAVSAERGYLLTGEEIYLDPYTNAAKTIDLEMKHLRKLTADNKAQQLRLDRLDPLIAEKMSEMKETINQRKSRGIETALQMLRLNMRKKVLDDIIKINLEIENTESQLLQQRSNELKSSARITMMSIILGIPLTIILLAALSFLITRNIVQPLRDITASAEHIAAGELDIRALSSHRTDEIGILEQAFTRVVVSLSTMAESAEQIAAGDLSAVVTPQSERDVIRTSLAKMIVSLNSSARIARQIADGNLTVVVIPQSEKDGMGNALAFMVKNLRELTKDIIEGINILAVSSSEIIASTTQVASGASQTSAAVGETTASVEEVKQTAMVANQKARNVSDAAQKTVKIAQGGKNAVDDSIAGMNRIQGQVESIAESIERLSEQGQAIGRLMETVNDLAEQSNLLAVNAAIEAAKAGDQGKGFAVVAQEVKSLSLQSKEATSQVRAILNDVQKATNAAVLATEQGSKAVAEGVRMSKEAGEAIRLMNESIDESAQAAIQIAVSSQQQVIGMDQVALAMASIRQASEQNVTGMRQVEITVQGLLGLGQKMKDLVAQFKV